LRSTSNSLEIDVRILLLSQFYPPIAGGEERHVRNLATALSGRGHTVSVVTLWFPGACDTETKDDITVYRIKGSLQRLSGLFLEDERRHAPPFPDPELVAALRRIVAQLTPDVVHAHNWLVDSFLPLKSWSGAALVVTLHDYSLICPKKNLMHDGEVCDGPHLAKCCHCAGNHYGTVKGVVTTLGNFGSSYIARRSVDKFLAVSPSVARHNRLAEFGVNHEVITNFIPDDVAVLSPEIDPCVGELPDEYILFVGDLNRVKGVPVLLDAYAGLEDAPPLVLIGRRCVDMPDFLPPNVHQFGVWSHQAIMHAWRNCLFGVAPSTAPEACATVLMEAMASGKPVVSTNIGGTPDIIVDGSTGILVPPDDVDALRTALQELLTNRDIITRMGQASREHAAHFKSGSVVPRIEQVYHTVTQACPV
jgi:glycosyltransferase involved in cell wall biosynthesis